jgi:protein farnesyltransferase subunit beta
MILYWSILISSIHRHPDAYHTCYNMAGLSACQNYYQYQPSSRNTSNKFSDLSISDVKPYPPLTAAFHWKAQKTPFNGRKQGGRIFYETDRAGLINPVYVIPAGAAERARQWYEERPLMV